MTLSCFFPQIPLSKASVCAGDIRDSWRGEEWLISLQCKQHHMARDTWVLEPPPRGLWPCGGPSGLHSGIPCLGGSPWPHPLTSLPSSKFLFVSNSSFMALAPVERCSQDHSQSALKSVFLNKDSSLPKRNCRANASGNSWYVSHGPMLNGLFRPEKP